MLAAKSVGMRGNRCYILLRIARGLELWLSLLYFFLGGGGLGKVDLWPYSSMHELINNPPRALYFGDMDKELFTVFSTCLLYSF